MTEQEQLTGEEKLKGHLHDTLSDLLYEKMPSRELGEFATDIVPSQRSQIIERAVDSAIKHLDEGIEELETEMEEYEPVCSACKGSGGGRGYFKCRKCGGSGRP